MAWTARNSEGFEAPAAFAADVVALTVRDGHLLVLTVEREGAHGAALPGGFVRPGEPLDVAARRLLRRNGLEAEYLEQLGAYADAGRDPRGWIPAVGYLALVPPHAEVRDPGARWIDAHGAPGLAFDHDRMLVAAIERLKGKLWWSNIAVGILPGEFALSDARQVYEAIAGIRYDPGTFGRDLKATGLVQRTSVVRARGPGRPAALYRFATSDPAWGMGRRKRVVD